MVVGHELRVDVRQLAMSTAGGARGRTLGPMLSENTGSAGTPQSLTACEPLGEDVDYATNFASLDVEALKKDVLRTKEIGVRKALGASVFDIVKLLVWQFSRPVIAANVIAWPVAFYLMHRWLSGFRDAIHLTDPLVFLGIFGGASLLAVAIAWLTIAGQSFNVARAKPGRALRCE